MRLTTVYVVSDPTPESTLADVLWEATIDRFALCVLGGPRFAWIDENWSVYSDRAEAEADARARMAKASKRHEQRRD